MAKINLSSIQNKANITVQNTDITKVQKLVPQKSNNIPSFNEVLTTIKNPDKNINKATKTKYIVPETLKEPKKPKDVYKSLITKPKDETIETEQPSLTEQERNKLIALLNMYLAEFPDKLKQYKQKNFNKMKDGELQEMKKLFQREVSTSNSLNMAVEMSGKVLELYEFLMTDYIGVNIKGISNLQKDEEYKNCMKALLLKYMSSSLISQVEPEMKLAYLVVSNSLICHQINSLQELQQKTQHIEATQGRQPINQLPQQIEPKKSLTEDEKIIKGLEIRNINNKYLDL